MGYAVLAGDLARVRLLLSLGADPDEAWGTGTPLLQVVDEPLDFFEQQEMRIAEALLDAGAAVDARNPEGQTPLHLVVERENVAGVELLLARGADRTLLDNNGESAFDVASRLADAMETTSDELTAIIQLLRPPA